MKPLIAGNWKMNLTRGQSRRLAEEIVRGLPAPLDFAEVALFPPYFSLPDVMRVVTGAGTDITVGAQNVHPQDHGAFTGEVSPPMLLDVGATRVLCGHSERRHLFGEGDEFVNRKVRAALGHDILPVLCVGETIEEREADQTTEVVERQIRGGLERVPPERAGDMTIAYEPVWAIGTGLTATPAQVAEVHARIRELLAAIWGDAAGQVRILYGGSVKPDNARELLATPDVDGALVGGASLDEASFLAIVRAAAP